jgi:hypothetical protein
MNPSPDELEKRIHRTLRALPERQAPQSLENRVLAELSRRAALPWWRRSYLQWPLAMRAGFVVLSTAAGATLIWVMYGIRSSGELAEIAAHVSQHFQWLAIAQAVGASLIQAGGDLARAIPPLWLYTGLGVLAACYATLAGVGAAAYRAFFPTR